MERKRVESSFRAEASEKAGWSSGGMVSSAFPQATEAGVAMLEGGGNAIDASCAAALALTVCEPQASGIGGQTMALVHLGGRTFSLDGSGPVPAGFPAESPPVLEANGYGATTVPTTLAALGHLHRRYGRLPWREVVLPAAALAREGYRITPLQRSLQIRELSLFESVPGRSGARYFLKGPGMPFEDGDLFRQPELAALLDGVAGEGPEFFYTGDVARRIEEDMRSHGGHLRAGDLAAIPWPVERGVVETDYRGVRVVTTPPPMGGRLLLFVLNVLKTLPSEMVAGDDLPRHHLLAELFRGALLRRGTPPLHPDGYAPLLDPLLADGESHRRMAERLLAGEGSGAAPGLRAEGPGETTHLSAMDAEGNAVGITQSVNMVYGAKAAAEGLGFLYNNYLLDTHRTDPGHPHFLKAGNRPWSSACPTLVFQGDAPWLLTGSPGSDRIISTVAQFLLHVLDAGCSIDEASDRPRLHCNAEGAVSLESDRFPHSVAEFFEAQGYPTTRREGYAFHHGAIHAVLREAGCRGFQGIAEVRRDGSAAGPGPATGNHPQEP